MEKAAHRAQSSSTPTTSPAPNPRWPAQSDSPRSENANERYPVHNGGLTVRLRWLVGPGEHNYKHTSISHLATLPRPRPPHGQAPPRSLCGARAEGRRCCRPRPRNAQTCMHHATTAAPAHQSASDTTLQLRKPYPNARCIHTAIGVRIMHGKEPKRTVQTPKPPPTQRPHSGPRY